MDIETKFKAGDSVFWLTGTGIRPGVVKSVIAEETINGTSVLYMLSVGSQYDKIRDKDIFKTKEEAGEQMLINNGLDIGIRDNS